jgi:predicted porin
MKKYYFSFGYSQLPEYYLRNLQYKDYSYPKSSIHYVKNVQASLKKNSFEFEVGGNLSSKFFSSLLFDVEQTSYNREFEERNSTTNVFALDGSYKLTRATKLNVDYTYSNAKADGRDNPDTNIADVSNYSHRFNAGAEIDLKRATKLPIQWRCVVVYESQSYTSEKSADKFHLGRKDNFYKIFTEIEYRLFKNVNLSLNYFWEENSTNLEETSDAGSYQTHQLGLGLEYAFRF